MEEVKEPPKRGRGRPRDPPMTEKKCNECRIVKPVAEFHKCLHKYQANCKVCHNRKAAERYRNNYQKIPTGPGKLPADKQATLREMLADCKKLAEISRTLEIPYPRLQQWKRKGKI